jgi:lipopolysaccharide export system protein LptA
MKILFILLLLLSFPASAQDIPIEISADENLEWRQKDKQYIANGNVQAKQGDAVITSDKLVADYKENAEGKTEIWRLTATGNVVLQNQDSIVTGAQAIYLVDSGQATVTGDNLKLTTPEETITAREKLTYNTQTLVAQAIGNAEIIQTDKKLNAASITANFIKDKNGKQILKDATANSNVRITTPDEVLTGDNGFYNAQTSIAEVKGNVKIVRGPNSLEGERAEVNLETNLSKMFSNPKTGERVKAVFFPGSEDGE